MKRTLGGVVLRVVRGTAIGAMLLALICFGSAAQADSTDRSWVFTAADDQLGWIMGPHWSSFGVAAGYWWGITSGVDPYLTGPDSLNLSANARQYVSVRMRMRMASPEARFGRSNAQIYFVTTADGAWGEDKKLAFLTYGNGEWKTYNIRVGDHLKWTGTIRRFRIDPNGQSGSRVEIAWIKVMQDTTAPTFTAENMWTYPDGGATVDTTPTLSLRNVFEDISGIDRAEFYWRPGASKANEDWVLDSIDADSSDGYQGTFQPFEPGVYDLCARVWDKSGNAIAAGGSDETTIEDLTIDPTMPTVIRVEAAAVGDDVPRDVLGHNLAWQQWSAKYNASTNSLPSNLENRIAQIGAPVCRYPGGCHTDTFYWKRSIGPVASRPNQYTNGCNTTLTNNGPAKFGLDEFLRWCEARGFEPMFTCRFRWPGAPPAPGLDGADPYAEALADAIDLVEYCNSPNDGSNPNGGTDWAAMRATNGHPEPYNVKLFEIGNEPWGPDPYGSPGNTGLDGASEYSVAFVDYLQEMMAIDPSIRVSATTHLLGQLDFDPASPDWTFSVYSQVGSFINYAQGHPYLPYSSWQTDLVKLYEETMATPKGIDDLLSNQRNAIARAVPERSGQIRLRLTEWNINYGWVYNLDQGRVNVKHVRTLKAALAAADSLRVLIENRDFVESAEWWHLYNGTWACIGGDDVTVYPVYHAYRLFHQHFGDKLVNSSVVGSPTFDYVQSPGSVLKSHYGLAYLTSIASSSADGKTLYLMVVNKDRTTPREAMVNISNFLPTGASQIDVETWELNGPDVDDYTNVQNVGITTSTTTRDASFSYVFPAHSVTSFKIEQTPVEASIVDVKKLADGLRVSIPQAVVTTRFDPDSIYLENVERVSGILVTGAGATVARGNLASVTGRLSTKNGERLIEAEAVDHDASSIVLQPWGMPIDRLNSGIDTTGLLMRLWGYTGDVTKTSFALSTLPDFLNPPGAASVRVDYPNGPADYTFVQVTGVRSRDDSGEPLVRTRYADDLREIE